MHNFYLLLAALLALFIAMPAGAQVNIGVIGGVNIANLSGEEVDGSKIDFSGRTAFGAGGVLDIRFKFEGCRRGMSLVSHSKKCFSKQCKAEV